MLLQPSGVLPVSAGTLHPPPLPEPATTPPTSSAYFFSSFPSLPVSSTSPPYDSARFLAARDTTPDNGNISSGYGSPSPDSDRKPLQKDSEDAAAPTPHGYPLPPHPVPVPVRHGTVHYRPPTTPTQRTAPTTKPRSTFMIDDILRNNNNNNDSSFSSPSSKDSSLSSPRHNSPSPVSCSSPSSESPVRHHPLLGHPRVHPAPSSPPAPPAPPVASSLARPTPIHPAALHTHSLGALTVQTNPQKPLPHAGHFYDQKLLAAAAAAAAAGAGNVPAPSPFFHGAPFPPGSAGVPGAVPPLTIGGLPLGVYPPYGRSELGLMARENLFSRCKY